MCAAGIFIGILGLIYGIFSYRSAQKLRKRLHGERDLIREKILDIRQDWKGYLSNEKVRIEDIKGQIAILDRFVERLEKLS